MFAPALRRERALGINFWDGRAPEILEGPVFGLGFFGVPGGPLDVWDDVTDPDQCANRSGHCRRGRRCWRWATPR
ncbi:hypothetical protein [Amycolatopsis sp. NPDC051071]|uniref:hypothetical protein n=1 Tax=Amycolatopsis sp. NPDC051071 TaxID=3154637 RepID=UPI0034420F58